MMSRRDGYRFDEALKRHTDDSDEWDFEDRGREGMVPQRERGVAREIQLCVCHRRLERMVSDNVRKEDAVHQVVRRVGRQRDRALVSQAAHHQAPGDEEHRQDANGPNRHSASRPAGGATAGRVERPDETQALASWTG